MSELIRELTDAELKHLVKVIAAPTFKYFMRRVQNNILLDKKMSDMSINSFITVLIVSIATLDANALRWIEKFYKMKIGKDIDFDKLKMSLTKNLYEQLGIDLN